MKFFSHSEINTVAVLGTFYDPQELKQEIKEFKEFSEEMNGSFDIKFAMV